MSKYIKILIVCLVMAFTVPVYGIGESPISGGGGDMLSTNNLSDVASKAVSRTNLGIAIGSDIQAFSANLATFALGNTSAGRTLLGVALASDVQSYSATLALLASLSATPANALVKVNAAGNGFVVTSSITASALNLTLANSSIPQPLAAVGSIPAACTVGMKWQASDTGTYYSCQSANTWVVIATGVIGSDIQAFSSNLATFALGNTSAGRILFGLAIGSDVQAYSAALVTLTGAQTLTNKILTAPMIQGYEIIASQTRTLFATECYGSRINNFGQATNAIITLPTVDYGMDMVFTMGTATAATYTVNAATDNSIYASGAVVASGVYMTPAVGNFFVFYSLKTGTSTWSWIVKSGQGALVAY